MQYRRIIRQIRDRLRPVKPGEGTPFIDLKSEVMEQACRAQGLPVTRVDERTIEVRIAKHPVLFYNMNGPHSSIALKRVCDNKDLARRLLEKEGLSVPRTLLAAPDQLPKFLDFAREIGYPVVVKPLSMSQGIGVYTAIAADKALKEALLRVADLQGTRFKPVLLEKHHQGEDHRFIVVDGAVVSVSKRMRAHVVGDGASSVGTLIQRKNEVRRQNPYLGKHPIPLQPELLDRLSASGMTLDSVPEKGTRVVLRDISNLKAGGDSVDVTDTIHAGYKAIAIQAIQAMPGMCYGGVDILIEDADAAPSPSNHVVSEVEFSPGPGPLFPVEGKPRDTAAAVLQHYMHHFHPSETP